MTIEVDIDKLNARKVELEAEIKQISDLLTLAKQFAKVITPSSPSLPSTPTIHTMPLVLKGNTGTPKDLPKRGFTAGLSRAVTLGLHTGPATESDLAKALAWDSRRVRQVVSSMLKFKLCYLSEHGKLTLTEEGKKQAVWFINNPSYLTYATYAKGAVNA